MCMKIRLKSDFHAIFEESAPVSTWNRLGRKSEYIAVRNTARNADLVPAWQRWSAWQEGALGR